MDARVGIEPTMQLLQSRALPLGYPALLAENVSAVYRNNVLFVNRFTSLDAYETFILIRVVGDAFGLTIERSYSNALTSNKRVNIFALLF